MSHTGTAFPCTYCKVKAVSQYHLAMVDGTIRNFCSYTCVKTFRVLLIDLLVKWIDTYDLCFLCVYIKDCSVSVRWDLMYFLAFI